MWKSAYVGVYQLLDWRMHGETLKFVLTVLNVKKCICWCLSTIGLCTI